MSTIASITPRLEYLMVQCEGCVHVDCSPLKELAGLRELRGLTKV